MTPRDPRPIVDDRPLWKDILPAVLGVALILIAAMVAPV